MPDQNPPTSSSDVGHQQSADGFIDVPTEVTSGGTLADNARLEHQPSATISNSCIDVSTIVGQLLLNNFCCVHHVITNYIST